MEDSFGRLWGESNYRARVPPIILLKMTSNL